MEGDMSWSMFPGAMPSNVDIDDLNFENHCLGVCKDRRDIVRSPMEFEIAPSTLAPLNRILDLHMTGALDPTDPYTDEDYDTQMYGHDARGFNLATPMDKYRSKAENIVKDFDFGTSGAYTGDSGTNPPAEFFRNIRNSRLWIQSLWKNFSDGLQNLNPRGLFAHDDVKVGKLQYESLNTVDPLPIPPANINRRLLPVDATNFRLDTEPSHVPGVSKYGMVLPNAGLVPINREIAGVRDDIIGGQLQDNIKLMPRVSDKTMSKLVGNYVIIDMMLKEQELAYNKMLKVSSPQTMKPYSISERDLIIPQKTILPGVMAIPPSTVNMFKNIENAPFSSDSIYSKNMFAPLKPLPFRPETDTDMLIPGNKFSQNVSFRDPQDTKQLQAEFDYKKGDQIQSSAKAVTSAPTSTMESYQNMVWNLPPTTQIVNKNISYSGNKDPVQLPQSLTQNIKQEKLLANKTNKAPKMSDEHLQNLMLSEIPFTDQLESLARR